VQSQFVPRGTESPSAATDHCGWLAVASDEVEHPAVNEVSAIRLASAHPGRRMPTPPV
jgi:hypothetical protein